MEAEELALLDQARSEARDDLNRLADAFQARRKVGGEDWALAWLVQGLIDGQSWSRLNLATVLGEAITRLPDPLTPKGRS